MQHSEEMQLLIPMNEVIIYIFTRKLILPALVEIHTVV
jgi:hypothetical protein